MKRLLIFLISASITSGLAYAQVPDFEEYKKQQQQGIADIKEEQTTQIQKAREEYAAYEKARKAEYDAFCAQVRKMWGQNQYTESTQKDWVEYSNDLSSRSVVDFANGTVKVEIVVDDKDMRDTAKINRRLESAVSDLLVSKGKSVDYVSKIDSQKPLADQSLLGNQINLKKYGYANDAIVKVEKKTKAVKSNNAGSAKSTAKVSEAVSRDLAIVADKIGRAVVGSQKPKVTTTTTNGKSGHIVSVSMQLVEDHIPQRAQKYRNHIAQYADKFSLDEPLIYAVMEQESYFNPAARSHVPAYGLMQLVPKSGGRDSYKYVYNVDRIPSPSYLLDPENNIELGSGYLRLLINRYFKNVKDIRSRMLCAIAAYNTGAGNVSRAFNKNTNISAAIPIINSMTYDELYTYLKKNLPHAETRDYIEKVTSKMQKYIK